MNPKTRSTMLACAALAACNLGHAQQHADLGKRVIEMPIKRSLKAATTQGKLPTQQPTARRDVGKFLVEGPIKTRITNIARRARKPHTNNKARMHNPKVAPGIVRWHANPAAAHAAAAKSGKPVLLFQLLGKLDDAFC